MDCQESASEFGDRNGLGCWEATDDLNTKALRKTTLWANTDPDTLPPQSNGAWVAQGSITVPGVDENGQPTDSSRVAHLSWFWLGFGYLVVYSSLVKCIKMILL